MILDRLENADRYAPLLPGLREAFDFLRQAPLDALAAGRHEIAGDRVFAIVARDAGRGHAASPLEAHRRYADVQYVVAGADEMGWKSVAQCRRERGRANAGIGAGPGSGQDTGGATSGCGQAGGGVSGGSGYDAEKDIVFYDDSPETWFLVPAGTFAVFFPEDAHAPLAGSGTVHKVVIKVAVA